MRAISQHVCGDGCEERLRHNEWRYCLPAKHLTLAANQASSWAEDLELLGRSAALDGRSTMALTVHGDCSNRHREELDVDFGHYLKQNR